MNRMDEAIIEILQDIRPEYDFATDRDFLEARMLDSFDVITIVTDIEERFNVLIDGEDIVPENFASVEAIRKLIEKSDSP